VFAFIEMQFGGDTIEGGNDEKNSIVLFEDLSVAVVVEIVLFSIFIFVTLLSRKKLQTGM